jgi:hypothetical protein
LVPNERVGADAHLFDVVANGAAFASYVLPNELGCAHWGAHDAKTLHLDYVGVREHGAEDLKVARLVSVDTITDKLVRAIDGFYSQNGRGPILEKKHLLQLS